jgi:hypothetical protein
VGIDPTRSDERFDVLMGDPDVRTELDVGDSVLGDQPAENRGLVASRSAAWSTVSKVMADSSRRLRRDTAGSDGHIIADHTPDIAHHKSSYRLGDVR